MPSKNYDRLCRFYSTLHGGLAARLVTAHLMDMAADEARHIQGDVRAAVGIGYATPYMPIVARFARERLQLMLTDSPTSPPANPWHDTPSESETASTDSTSTLSPATTSDIVTAITRADSLPLLSASLDMVLIAHAIENLADGTAVDALLAEIWRVLRGDGRLLAVVACRPSFWQKTLGAAGYTRLGLKTLLRRHGFVVHVCQPALILPPLAWASYQRLAAGAESKQALFGWLHAGVLLIDAKKTMYTPRLVGQVVKQPARQFAPVGRMAGADAMQSRANHAIP